MYPNGNISGSNRTATPIVPERDALNELARCDREIAAYRAIIMTDERWLLAYVDWQVERDMILDNVIAARLLRSRNLMTADEADDEQDQRDNQAARDSH